MNMSSENKEVSDNRKFDLQEMLREISEQATVAPSASVSQSDIAAMFKRGKKSRKGSNEEGDK